MEKEEKLVEAPQAPEKKVVAAYTIVRFDDGSTEVQNAGFEGAMELSKDDIFKDIENVANQLESTRIQNAAYVGAYNGTARFYEDVRKANAATAAADGDLKA